MKVATATLVSAGSGLSPSGPALVNVADSGPGLAEVALVDTVSDERGWGRFVDTHPDATIYHGIRWRKLIRDVFGHTTYWLAARSSEGDTVGALPLVRLKSLLFGDYMVSLPFVNYGGALAHHPEVETVLMQEAVSLAREAGCSHVEFRDVHPRNGHWSSRTDKVVMELALTQDPDELFRSLGSKLRAQVRRSLREGATVHHGGRELLDDFYTVFSRNMRDLGTPVYSKRLFTEIFEPRRDSWRLIGLSQAAKADPCSCR